MIDWRQIAKNNNMSYEEFTHELIEVTMAHMANQIVKLNSDEMIVTNSNIVLSCRLVDLDNERVGGGLH